MRVQVSGVWSRIHVLAAVLALASCRDARADSDDETAIAASPIARGQALLSARAARWQWQVVKAPKLATQIGVTAVSGLDVAAGRRPAPVPVLGEPVPVPARWPYGLD